MKHRTGFAVAAVPAWFRAKEADGGEFGGVVAVMAATNASFSSAVGRQARPALPAPGSWLSPSIRAPRASVGQVRACRILRLMVYSAP
jgi:hypothetical protein